MRAGSVSMMIVAWASSLALAGCSDSAEPSAAATTLEQQQAPTPTWPRLEHTELIGFEDDEAVANEAFDVLRGLATLPRADALTPAAAAALGDAELLPDEASLTIRSSTWERRGRLAAVVVDVRLTGAGDADEFVAYLVATEGGWRLSHTERVSP